MPWRNGGGVTRELLAWPDPHDWLLRVSVADIHASGPFSKFPGVDRWFAVLAGGAVSIETAGAAPRRQRDAMVGRVDGLPIVAVQSVCKREHA